MGPFTLPTDQAKKLDRAGAGRPEPMWGTGVEFCDLSRFEDEVMFAENQPEPAVEDVDPIEALMGTEHWFRIVSPDGQNEFV